MNRMCVFHQNRLQVLTVKAVMSMKKYNGIRHSNKTFVQLGLAIKFWAIHTILFKHELSCLLSAIIHSRFQLTHAVSSDEWIL